MASNNIVLSAEELETVRIEEQMAYRGSRARKPVRDNDFVDVLLRGARSHYAKRSDPAPEETLSALYNITASGPTSMNTCPSRHVFITSKEGREWFVG